jgi:hypothetical protein
VSSANEKDKNYAKMIKEKKEDMLKQIRTDTLSASGKEQMKS